LSGWKYRKSSTRALGDLHPGGNPHIHTDPRNIARVALALEERMAQIDPANAESYHSRGKSFLGRWQAAIVRWEQQVAPLKGVPIVVYHKDFSYFINWAGMREAGSLEPKPGLPHPGASRRSTGQNENPARQSHHLFALQQPQAAEFLSTRANIPA